ncbi:methyl-accepting chemotaxis protein [Undibacterium parvum]|uniref:PAS domain-containing methyl-accepting chemotaxis protein n=1 Tax=Undibacterium parvum TaxID=401471 RepID=A0A3Q9BND9_9BURK|nr:PAS domain-containing methyl-accepting chemotaxis protein [Undibacterium parvum]AZP10905.1 PAS domain-containing methyl-accepting chemotaxis protein [Undibacterium parvum]
MRINTPVTQIEYIFKDGESIVSTTDLNGNINYANPYFIEASGFQEHELLGAPQNILRHPDMPAEAFTDMWATIKSGVPWSGMVKNRRKNGDYYWVLANVTPVIENGMPSGYMSVRTKPDREQIKRAEAIYQELRSGNANQLRIRHGQVVRSGIGSKLAALKNMSLGTRIKLNLGFTAISTLMLALSALLPEFVIRYQLQSWLCTLGLSSTAVSLLFWHFLYVAIVHPVTTAIKISRTMAGGDLTSMIESEREDEIGHLLRSLRQLNINLYSIIGDVRKNFYEISIATQEIADGNMDLSGRTESQASALEQTASSMEQLAATVDQNTDNAIHAHKMASNAASVAQNGGKIVAEVIGTISEISTSSKKIVDIISIIDGIAFQTNILALNAAVEAARAGEQGRGFAVVASEVRNLAQRSAAAAKEISILIKLSVEKVDAGTVLAERSGSAMTEIITSVKRVTDTMSEIASASTEQRDGISQVNDAVTQMDEVTQQNAALVEQAAAAAASLNEQTFRLTKAMEVFKL